MLLELGPILSPPQISNPILLLQRIPIYKTALAQAEAITCKLVKVLGDQAEYSFTMHLEVAGIFRRNF